MEEDSEVDNIVLPERTSEKIWEQSKVIEAAKTSCQDRKTVQWSRTSVEVVKKCHTGANF